MPGRVELIAYADRFGGDLPGLRALLDGPLAGLFGGVHVLPFYRPFDGADAGFDPEDHTEVDERLGSWDNVAALSKDRAVMVDVIVNHVSSASPQFLDWLARGSQSQYDGMFLTLGGAFPDGAREQDLVRLYRPRPGLPFTTYQLADGSKRLVWTTFTAQQVDLDVRAPATQAYLRLVLDRIAHAGVSHVRLDAVGYAVKTPGSTSFMTPETFAFIDTLTEWCHDRDLEVLVEVHSYYQQQIEIARKVDRVYDFALPPLVLHALTAGDADPLLSWLVARPTNAVTVLDTHDGIGVSTSARTRRTAPSLGCSRQSRSTRWWRPCTSTAAGPHAGRPGSPRQTSTCTRSTARSTTRWAVMTTATCWRGRCSSGPWGFRGLLRRAACRLERYGAVGRHRCRPRCQSASVHP